MGDGSRTSWLILKTMSGHHFLLSFVEVGGGWLVGPRGFFFSEQSIECCIILEIAGTHITNTREAKAFALLSEEGIAKGIRRVTAVTTECAFDALNVASSLEKEVEDASKAEGSALEKVTSLLSYPFTILKLYYLFFMSNLTCSFLNVDRKLLL